MDETPAEAVHIMLGSIALIIAAGVGILSLSAGILLLSVAIGAVMIVILVDIAFALRRSGRPGP
ncbi:hypothetical protein [Nonomuraea basaltis]|uniref:hypothetical protein n=1 Tax=Nonomuraea basaltis TaxID=2495887 RepID=UPI00110C5B9D|nr:hypothetical protein [Nonomuraea basaltis]TMR94949.1 hypothetical protein EJK15_30990 [Nonomuraea basaltis]